MNQEGRDHKIQTLVFVFQDIFFTSTFCNHTFTSYNYLYSNQV